MNSAKISTNYERISEILTKERIILCLVTRIKTMSFVQKNVGKY